MARTLVKLSVLWVAMLSAATNLAGAETVTFLDQGWSKEIRELFYFTPQGSRIIPYAWFLALEVPESQAMFADTTNLTRYGLIPADEKHPLNPSGLPIGFAIDPVKSPDDAGANLNSPGASPGPYLGLTCAACHTGNVTVEGRPIRVDGGASQFDFDSFYADLAAAVSRTLFDPAKFERFSDRVLANPAQADRAQLQQALAAFQAKMAGEAAVRHPTLASGFGRVDALTQIVNALSVTDQGDPLNLRQVGAPTSYPPLWLAPSLEFVQWSPIAGNPLGRNAGEVLGVFGVSTLTGDPRQWFASSILLKELNSLETWIADLKPPPWDEALLGKLDPVLVARGEVLFRDNCASCHNMPPYRQTDPSANHFKKTFIEIGRVDYRKVGTDPMYVEALSQRLVRTNSATQQLNDGKTVVPAATYFLKTVGAVITRAMQESNLSEGEKAAMIGFRLRPPKTNGDTPEPYSPNSLTDLKASPLAGIWATGPYLHNGSVPTVYELLSPVEERRKIFWTGGQELDRERLGFVSDDSPGRFRFDTSLPGNRNSGHLFPSRGLDPDERKAIIEWLKTQ